MCQFIFKTFKFVNLFLIYFDQLDVWYQFKFFTCGANGSSSWCIFLIDLWNQIPVWEMILWLAQLCTSSQCCGTSESTVDIIFPSIIEIFWVLEHDRLASFYTCTIIKTSFKVWIISNYWFVTIVDDIISVVDDSSGVLMEELPWSCCSGEHISWAILIVIDQLAV